MNALGVVVADTTPLNYLIVIDRAEILAELFGEVLIPEAVLEELRHPKAPVVVSRWLRDLPAWLRITPVLHIDETIQPTPISPPSGLCHLLRQDFEDQEGYDRQAGPIQWLFLGPPAESKVLAATAVDKKYMDHRLTA